MRRAFYYLAIIPALILQFFIFNPTVSAQPNRSFLDTVLMTFGLKEDNSPKPHKTLIAPFADDGVKEIPRISYEDAKLPVNQIPLHIPHRANREISAWVAQAVMDTLTLTKTRIKRLNVNFSPYFTEKAFEQYKDFGQKSNIFSAIFFDEQGQERQAGNERETIAFSKEDPLFIRGDKFEVPLAEVKDYKDHNVDGENPDLFVYQWVFEVPVTISLIDLGVGQYNEDITVSNTQTQREISVCITVSRSEKGGDEGILISDWDPGSC